MYNTTNMGDTIQDGDVRQVYNTNTNDRYKVTIPPGFVAANRNTLPHLGDEWVIGDPYVPSDNFQSEELPDEFKRQLGLMPPAAAADGPGQRRGNNDENEGPDARRQRVGEENEIDGDGMGADGMDGGKSNKRSIRRRRRSSSRKSRKSSRKSRKSSRKSRNARRK